MCVCAGTEQVMGSLKNMAMTDQDRKTGQKLSHNANTQHAMLFSQKNSDGIDKQVSVN